MVTMFGCDRRPAVCASRKKRSFTSAGACGSNSCVTASVLIAPSRPIFGSLPRYTTPIAPLPSSFSTSKRPNFGFTPPGASCSVPPGWLGPPLVTGAARWGGGGGHGPAGWARAADDHGLGELVRARDLALDVAEIGLQAVQMAQHRLGL